MARAFRLPKPRITTAPEWAVELVLPLVLKSAPNLREHHMARARRVKKERQVVADGFDTLLPSPYSPMIPIGYVVTVNLTRIGGRGLDDDNLQGSLKGARDQVAEWVGLDDGSKIYDWQYAETPGPVWGVGIRIRCHPDDRQTNPGRVPKTRKARPDTH